MMQERRTRGRGISCKIRSTIMRSGSIIISTATLLDIDQEIGVSLTGSGNFKDVMKKQFQKDDLELESLSSMRLRDNFVD